MSVRPSLLERAGEFRKTTEFSKLWRYASVSVISTVVSLAMLYFFYRVVGLKPWVANIVATCIATVPSYYLNRSWAWGKSGKSHMWREVVPFWVIAFVSLGLSTIAVQTAASQAHHLSHRQDVRTALILFANFFTYGVIWVGKFILFNKVLFKHHAPKSDEGAVALVG